MKKRVLHCFGLLTAIGLIGTATDLHAGKPEAAAPVEHHIYLHIMPPKDGEPVRVIVAPHEEKVVKKEKELVTEPAPLPIEGETEVGALIEELVPEEESVADVVEDDVAEEIEEKEVIIPFALKDEDAAEVTEKEIEVVTPEDIEIEEAVLDEITTPVLVDKDEAILTPPPTVAPPVEESIVLDETTRDAPMGLLLFIFVLAIFLGFELISKVPSQLHTPLMSGSNAISGITIVGALAAAGLGVGGAFGTFLGALAVIFATINVVGGYMVTNRMLGMFKKKDGGAHSS